MNFSAFLLILLANDNNTALYDNLNELGNSKLFKKLF